MIFWVLIKNILRTCSRLKLLTKRMVKMDGYWPSSLFAFFPPIKTQKRTRSIPCYLDRTSLVDKGFHAFMLLCVFAFVFAGFCSKMYSWNSSRVPSWERNHRKSFYGHGKFLARGHFCAFAWTTTKFIARTIQAIPSGQYCSISPTRIAHWRSQSYSWFSLTWWDGHVGEQNNGKTSPKICVVIESNSQQIFFAIVLYTNMAPVTSHENRE